MKTKAAALLAMILILVSQAFGEIRNSNSEQAKEMRKQEAEYMQEIRIGKQKEEYKKKLEYPTYDFAVETWGNPKRVGLEPPVTTLPNGARRFCFVDSKTKRVIYLSYLDGKLVNREDTYMVYLLNKQLDTLEKRMVRDMYSKKKEYCPPTSESWFTSKARRDGCKDRKEAYERMFCLPEVVADYPEDIATLRALEAILKNNGLQRKRKYLDTF